MDMVKVGIIVPHRNDRPRFMYNCLRLIEYQTLQPCNVEIVKDNPTSSDCDITKRYKKGYDALRNKGLDIIALMEDDDWYSCYYLETMVNEWKRAGKPDIFGLNHTIYYNIRLFAWFKMNHTQRSSAMNTLIKPDLNLTWCEDNDPFTDIHLWQTIENKLIIETPQTLCLGIKHGEGLCGGKSHVDRLHRYVNGDTNRAFLKQTVDKESFKFYSNYFDR